MSKQRKSNMTINEVADHFVRMATPEQARYPDQTSPCLRLESKHHDGGGYPCVSFKGNYTKLSRIISTAYDKDIPQGYQVCHTCDRPWCIQPDHLVQGTRSQNMRDKVRAGTDNRGEKHHLSILTRKNIQYIKSKYDAGGITQLMLANKFGVSQTTISSIITNKTWNYDNQTLGN